MEDGYTVVSDRLIREFGHLTALVYGVVYRYSRFDRNRCDASLSTIGEQIGVTRKAVSDHVKKLVDAGYLTKVEAKNGGVNFYYVTDKLQKGYIPVTLSDTPPVTESYTPVTESYTPLSPKVTPPVTESYRCNVTPVTLSDTKNNSSISNNNDNSGSVLTALTTNYQDVISVVISPLMADELKEYAAKVQPVWVANAFKVAESQNVRKWSYVRAILDSCIAAGAWVDKRGNNGRNNSSSSNGRMSIG